MNNHSRRVVLSAVGTLGDALPLAAIGNELAVRGYEVHLLGNQPFARGKLDPRVRLTLIAPPQQNNLAPLQHNLDTYHFASYAPCYELFRGLDLGTRTLVVNTMNFSATNSLAELYQLPVFRLVLAPFHVPSLLSPPSPMREAARGPMGHTFTKYTLPAIYGQRDTSTRLLDPINGYRQQWGLAPIRVLRHAERFVCGYAGLFPDWFGQPADDWPENFVTAGFPLTPAQGCLPDDIGEFIDREGAPMVFTPGTGVVDVDEFFSYAAKCCQRLGLPGLFLSRSLVSKVYDGAIKLVPYVDLEALLPQARLLVHHGGIGTTARAFAAGVPQVVVPIAYDQPDNARRVAELNAGVALGPKGFTLDSLTQTVARLLGDQRVARAVGEWKAKLAQERGLQTAVEAIELQFESAISQPARAKRPRSEQREANCE